MLPSVRLRVSVVALFVDADAVLLLHQMTLPEPDCWDLPGGGLEPHEQLLDGLAREVEEETGIAQFKVDRLLTVHESFFPRPDDTLHTLNIVYQCSLSSRPVTLTGDPAEVGVKGIRWMRVAELQQEECSSRSWAALQAAGLVEV
jgi:8-oxo-dGTP diphosphatase